MKKDDKLNVYEMIFTVIAIVFLTLGALILFDYIHINNQFGNLYFSAFFITMFIIYIRRSKIIALLYLIAGILYLISIINN
ncbi:hypothetical protein [Staphylococcus gallinarum]|uniref:hypothetical protein n=1 Tax=Staphylococcus gallinarum TaxID=1293 RepID=UPI001E5D1A54|nr:hypothetical protein [Staphylococcus gallinarum]MCD8918749.1 hypothetical protein [Staphylococcus gallinarum]